VVSNSLRLRSFDGSGGEGGRGGVAAGQVPRSASDSCIGWSSPVSTGSSCWSCGSSGAAGGRSG